MQPFNILALALPVLIPIFVPAKSQGLCQTCDQTITGRNFNYARALEIIQEEEYLEESDFDDIRHRYKRRTHSLRQSQNITLGVILRS